MTKKAKIEPWQALPPELADAIEPELPEATEEILATIAREVPEYARPLEGAFGVAIRTGVSEALRQFVDLIRDPGAGREPGRDVYVGLGRAELREGRTLDALQSAYRVGARVAWRRVSAAARRGGADPEQVGLLAEAIFAYIDELSADSVEGYCSPIRPPRMPRSAQPRRRRGGGCPGALRLWRWPRPISGGSAAGSPPTRWWPRCGAWAAPSSRARLDRAAGPRSRRCG